jgi:chromosome segregation ATPase
MPQAPEPPSSSDSLEVDDRIRRWDRIRGFYGSFQCSNLVLSFGVDFEAMAQEIKPDEIREASLNRRLRGYDPQETEQLLADVAESYEKVLAEREALSEQLEELQHEQVEHERSLRLQLERVDERLSDRERRVSELEATVARLAQERSNQLEEAVRLTDELARAQAAKTGQGSELAVQRESLARLEIHERALVEQIAMLEAQVEQTDEAEATLADRRAMAHLEERAARTLLRLDRLVEQAQRQTRRDAELTLKKARERADEIARFAGMERQAPAERWVHRGLQRDDRKEEVGEAAWTSRMGPDQLPQRPSF